VISVLIPLYNDAPTLARALRSVQRQTVTDWECVVADDGSTDEGPAVAARFSAADPRFRLLCLPHRGIVAALNDGVDACRGHYVARMDADDVCHPERLAAQRDAMERHPEVALASCLLRKYPCADLRVGMQRYEGWLNSVITPEEHARDIYVESPLAHPTAFLRRETLEALGGYHDPPWPEDYDLWLRIHQSGGRIAKVPRFLFFWQERSGRLSRVSERYGPDAFRRCKVSYLMMGPLRGHVEVIVWGAGSNGKPMACALVEAGLRIRAFVDIDPRKVGQRIGDAPVVGPADVPSMRGVPILAAVGKDGAREEVRAALRSLNFTEGRDFWCVC